MAWWNQKRAGEVGNGGVVAAMVVAVARARWWGVVCEVEDGMVIWCGRGWRAESEGDPWWWWRREVEESEVRKGGGGDGEATQPDTTWSPQLQLWDGKAAVGRVGSSGARAMQHSAPRAYERALATRPCAAYEEHACAAKGARAMVRRKGTIEARRTLKGRRGEAALSVGPS